MQFKLFKIIFILFLILYHSVSISKAAISNNFNQKYLSNYFSGLVSYDNQDNDLALKFFESSKALIKKHPTYLKQYVFSLVLDGQIAKATKQINFWKNNINSNFFEAKLLLVIDSISKKNYEKTKILIKELKSTEAEDPFEIIIYEILNSYSSLFLDKKIKKSDKNLAI